MTYAMPETQTPLTYDCPRCGAALPPRKRLRCNWTGLLCDIPCMYNVRENPTGALHPCRWPDGNHLYKG